VSLYDKDDPQAQEHAGRHRASQEAYTKRTDPLGYYWRRGLRALAQWRLENSS
jgi:hypothetical protein